MKPLTTEKIREMLKEVIDPELGVNIVDLGLVYDIKNEDGHVYVEMTLTTPGCPLHDTLTHAVKKCLSKDPSIASVDVNVVWNPPWNPHMMSENAKKQLGFF